MRSEISRRDLMKFAGMTAAGLALPRSIALAESAAIPPSGRRRVLRVAHLTDFHVQPERRANDGMIACLRHVQQLQDRPELILTGGDSIMDCFEADDARTTLQWNLWRSILKNECSIPVRSCIGNHDIWGWNKTQSKTRGDEPNWGKKRSVEMLALPHRYYSFEQAGWHFVVLDSTQPHRDGYVAFVDDEQLDWLTRDLQATPSTTPVLVISHIPIMSASAFYCQKDEAGRQRWEIGGSLIHLDALKLKDLFAKHRNVKLCLSGHIHLVDRVDYNGVTYLCNGAVCGRWWKGPHKECNEGYAVLDLFDDGTFAHEYVTYGWQAPPE